ncbi:MAG: phage tail tape measure protein, partial [Clostridium sporogenes]|nr:phage tail tape measure protein [Clostridium sporogenes]
GSNFEEGMSKVSAISGATGEDLKKLTEKAKEMGAKTKFSATESAEAMQYMAIAGWKTGDMLNGIDGIMNLAAASGEDLALVSDIVTDALTAFGMSAKDSAQFADLLASAASNSNTNVSMLGESFKYVAPVAGALGHSAKDTAFALGLMANAGIKSSQSGTALRASLTNLAHPSKNMAAEMERLGISLTDSNGKVKEGKALYDELRQKFSGLTDAQKTSSAATIFGKEAMSGMLAIINASDADYKKLYENLSNCDGAAENMANTMNDNLKGQITLLSSALESLGIELYEGVNNPMKEVVKTANEMVQQLTTAFKEGGLTSLVTELGNVFATIITNIAAQLPQMINLSVQVIQSFITGIQNNLPLIATSAIQIIQTLITGFITVFPQIIQLGLQLIIQLGTGIAQAIPTLLPQIINVVIGIADMIISNIGTIIEVGIKILMALV